MVLELKNVDYQVITINVCVKTKEFRELNPSLKVPVLIHGTNMFNLANIDDTDEAVDYIERLYPHPSLTQTQTKRSVGIGTDGSWIFSRFSALMRNKDPAKDQRLKEALLSELKRLDIFLRSKKAASGGSFFFMDGNTISMADCSLLPKLWHVKVAGPKKGFEIPETLEGVSEYLAMAMKNVAFIKSKPDDRVITERWQ